MDNIRYNGSIDNRSMIPKKLNKYFVLGLEAYILKKYSIVNIMVKIHSTMRNVPVAEG
jgi:hypothetical protein